MREIDDVYMSPPKGNFLVAELNARHLALRLFEVTAGIRHPENISLDEAADEIKARSPETYSTMMSQAHAALEYFEECMRGAKPERHQ
jgi:hypothetical protein